MACYWLAPATVPGPGAVQGRAHRRKRGHGCRKALFTQQITMRICHAPENQQRQHGTAPVAHVPRVLEVRVVPDAPNTLLSASTSVSCTGQRPLQQQGTCLCGALRAKSACAVARRAKGPSRAHVHVSRCCAASAVRPSGSSSMSAATTVRWPCSTTLPNLAQLLQALIPHRNSHV